MLNNLITVLLMLSVLGVIIVTNTILGIIIANKKSQFSWKILFSGLCKAIIIALCIMAFCSTLELIPIILKRVGIVIPTEIVTVLEIILTTLTAYKKYALDCFKKFNLIIAIKESDHNE